MEAVVGIKYRPVVFPNGVAAAVGKSKARAGTGGGEQVAAAVYRECLKNHAASLGGHALDGCGEFMPSPAVDAADPASLKCAACGCHRNFHRRLPEAPPSPPLLAKPPPPPPPQAQAQQQQSRAAPPTHLLHGSHQRGEETPEVDRMVHGGGGHHNDDDDGSEDSDEISDYDDDCPASPLPAPPVVLQAPGYLPSATHMLLSLRTGAPVSAPAKTSRPHASMGPPAPGSASAARKRFRTKFSPEQKQRMQALSERLGWRLQKRDEAVVEECCREIGVGKGVFKVWMHNNKHSFLGGHSARRSASAAAASSPVLHPSPHSAPAPLAPSPVHTDFNINGSSTHSAAADRPATTARGGSPQSS